MASPNAFIHWFSNRMRAVGVRFAITSGQACVHYGIQQTTKDSDWIIEPADFVVLAPGIVVALLRSEEFIARGKHGCSVCQQEQGAEIAGLFFPKGKDFI